MIEEQLHTTIHLLEKNMVTLEKDGQTCLEDKLFFLFLKASLVSLAKTASSRSISGGQARSDSEK